MLLAMQFWRGPWLLLPELHGKTVNYAAWPSPGLVLKASQVFAIIGFTERRDSAGTSWDQSSGGWEVNFHLGSIGGASCKQQDLEDKLYLSAN